MLSNMVKSMSSPAAHVCRARYCRNRVFSFTKSSKDFSSVVHTESPSTYVANSVRQQLVTCLCQKQYDFRLRSIWSFSSGTTFGSSTLRFYNKVSHYVDASTPRLFWSRIHSESAVGSSKDVIPQPPVVIKKWQASAGHQYQSASDRKLTVGSTEKLVKAILYEAQRGFVNVIGKNKRFGDFLYEQVAFQSENDQQSFSSETQGILHQLSQDSRLYDQMEEKERISLLTRVARSLGFENLQDLLDHDSASSEASQGLQVQAKVKEPELSAISSGPRSPSNDEVQVGSKEVGNNKASGTLPTPLSPVHPAIMFGSSQPIDLLSLGGQSAPMSSAQVADASNEIPESTSSVPAKGRKVASVKKTKKSGTRIAADVKVTPESLVELTTSPLKLDGVSVTTSKRASVKDNWGVDMPMSSMKCLSNYLRSRLEENGLVTMRNLLQHYPRMYRNFQEAGQRVEDGQHLSFVGTIVQSKGLPRGPSLGMTEVIIRSEVDPNNIEDLTSGNVESASTDGRPGQIVFLHLKKFYRGTRYASTWFLNAMANKYPLSSQVTVCGKVKAMHQPDHFEIREYNLELWDEDKETSGSALSLPETVPGGKPYPVYSAKGGLQSKTIEFCIQRVLPIIPAQIDPLSDEFRRKWQLQELRQAYIGIHSPLDARDAELARERLVFDEFFYLQLGMLLPRQEMAGKYLAAAGMPDPALVSKSGVLNMENWSPLTLKLVKSLPYTLTQSQIRAAGEIMWDLQRPVPMSRLLQGDVGCGKTVVAFLALLEVVDAGYQGALMAPTEFLAVQHYQRITSWLEKLDEGERPRVALLTGSTPVSKARVIRSAFESGEIDLAVGTHSLIADSVKFSALRLGVIDEQHRFGVAQRGRLNNKIRDAVLPDSIEGEVKSTALPPHVLAMSATPIPRTLALALHGDMALSQITELPPGRADTATYAILGDKKGRQEVYQKVREELENGGRVFIVYPVIEESEELPDVRAAETEYKNLEQEFKDYKCGLVHGRMRSHEKDEAMERFKAGETKVLVSTTVIEVGIDIPEASMIVIEHAERYGMAQLHQLRGRVGRGTRDSSCILLGSRPSSLARLKMLETSRDGFYLAEVDLKLRGPGDLLGKAQSGYLPEFHIARLEKDGEILEKARTAAEELLQLHFNLEGLPRIRQELSMRRPPNALS